MYIIFKNLHSFVALISLLSLLLAVIYASYNLIQGKKFTKASKIISLMALIGSHLQLLFGFLLYFLSPLGVSNLSSETMKSPISRLYAIEHPLMMIIAIVLVTIGYSKAKRSIEDKIKFKNISIFYAIGFLFIVSRIPWNAWLS